MSEGKEDASTLLPTMSCEGEEGKEDASTLTYHEL